MSNQTIKLEVTPRGGLLSSKPPAIYDALNMQLLTNVWQNYHVSISLSSGHICPRGSLGDN